MEPGFLFRAPGSLMLAGPRSRGDHFFAFLGFFFSFFWELFPLAMVTLHHLDPSQAVPRGTVCSGDHSNSHHYNHTYGNGHEENGAQKDFCVRRSGLSASACS